MRSSGERRCFADTSNNDEVICLAAEEVVSASLLASHRGEKIVFDQVFSKFVHDGEGGGDLSSSVLSSRM